MKKKNSKPWFRQTRWSYIGNSWQGALCYIPYLIVLGLTLNYSIVSSNGLTEVIFKLFPSWIATTIVMQWFASNKI